MKETRQQFDQRLYTKDDPTPAQIRAQKLGYRKFWCLWVPLGALLAGLVAMFAGSAGVFIPCWPVMTVFLWGIGESFEKGKR